MPDTGTVDMDFWDFVDIVNPLQHIPVVNTIYRELTGDTIKGVSRVIGGGLFGGVIGLVAGIGSAIVAETTGKDPGEHVLAMLTGSGDETPAPTGNPPSRKRRPRQRNRPPNRPRSGISSRIRQPTLSDPGLPQHRHGRTRRRRRNPDARRSCRGPGAAPAWRAGSAELPGAQAHGGPHAQAGAGRDRAGRPYRQDAGPARRRHLASERASAKPTASQARQPQNEARTLGQTRPDGGMAAERPRQGSAGIGGRYDDERVGQVQAGCPHRHRIHGERRRAPLAAPTDRVTVSGKRHGHPGFTGRNADISRRRVPLRLGRSGIRADKREGDGATPVGCFMPAPRAVPPRPHGSAGNLPPRGRDPAGRWLVRPPRRPRL